MSERYANVFDALGNTREEAVNMRLRAGAMLIIQQYVSELGTTQVKAAEALGLTQPRLNDLIKGRIDKFSLDTLFNLVSKTGKDIEVIYTDKVGVA
jgi:predicted XRE-type DNA-binding protein